MAMVTFTCSFSCNGRSATATASNVFIWCTIARSGGLTLRLHRLERAPSGFAADDVAGHSVALNPPLRLRRSVWLQLVIAPRQNPRLILRAIVVLPPYVEEP